MRLFRRIVLDPEPVKTAVQHLVFQAIQHGAGMSSRGSVTACENHLLMLLRIHGIQIPYPPKST